jgi:hypothetical protein
MLGNLLDAAIDTPLPILGGRYARKPGQPQTDEDSGNSAHDYPPFDSTVPYRPGQKYSFAAP